MTNDILTFLSCTPTSLHIRPPFLTLHRFVSILTQSLFLDTSSRGSDSQLMPGDLEMRHQSGDSEHPSLLDSNAFMMFSQKEQEKVDRMREPYNSDSGGSFVMPSPHSKGHANGHVNGHGHLNGHSNGHGNGHANGNGHLNGHSNGNGNGHGNGHLTGHPNGHLNGYPNGHSNGHGNGHGNGHPNGDIQGQVMRELPRDSGSSNSNSPSPPGGNHPNANTMADRELNSSINDSVSHQSPVYDILIVDDSALNRKMMRRYFTTSGHTCTEAIDGKHAVNLVKERLRNLHGKKTFDAILMDFVMPVMDGPSACKAIRARGYKSLIFGVTGNNRERDMEYFINSGADVVLSKPFDTDKFQHCMRTMFVPDSDSDSATALI